MRNYNNDLDAARGLLGEAASILNNQKIDFVVIGGWIPYLFNSEPISHPGTFDVDVLLNSETSRQAMNEAVDAFMKVGYLRSPKNAFQIFRILRVGTEDRVFHVDFLHRKYAEDVDDMIKDWGKIQSIAGPGTDIIFLESERRIQLLGFDLPDGTSQEIAIHFCTEVGFLSAKGRSASTKKRTRDAYDVFLVTKQSHNRRQLIERCRALMGNRIFSFSFEELEKGFRAGNLTSNAVLHLLQQTQVDKPLDLVQRTMDEFFEEVRRKDSV
jgi:hypothetical protein